MPEMDSGDLAVLRSHPQTVPVRYLAFAPRPSVYTARVNGSASRDGETNGIYRIPYDTGSGTLADVKVGMTLDVGTAAGARDIGSVRIRLAPAGGYFYVAETAPADLPVLDNHYLTVREEFRLWSIPPRLVGVKDGAGYTNNFTAYRDYDRTYASQNKVIQPIVNIRGRRTGFLDTGQTYRTVVLTITTLPMSVGATASNPTIDDRDCTTMGTVNTTVVDPLFGSTKVTELTLRVPQGFRYLYVTGNDSAGATHFHVYPLWALDEGDGYWNFNTPQDETREGAGREMGFDLFGAVGAANDVVIPKGSLCIYVDEPEFDGDPAPEESGYRHEFVGWVTKDIPLLQALRGRRRLTIAGPHAWLTEKAGYGETIHHKTTPTKWYELEQPTIDRVAHYVLRNFSTALTICNLYRSGLADNAGAEEIAPGSVMKQVTDLVTGYHGLATFDSEGNLWLRQDYPMMSADERDDRDVTLDIDEADLTDASGLELPTDYMEPVGLVLAQGSYWNGTESTQLDVKAPGKTPGQGAGIVNAPYQRLPQSNAIAVLKQRTGDFYKAQNNPQKSLPITLLDNLDVIEPAWNEPIRITWEEDTVSGVTLASALFMVRGVSIQHSNERRRKAKRIVWTVSRVTDGADGEQWTPPKSPGIDVGPTTMPPPGTGFPGIFTPTFPITGGFGLVDGLQTIILIDDDGGAYPTTNFEVDDPSYIRHDMGASGTPQQYASDPYSPNYIDGAGAVNGVLVTNSGIYTVADLVASAAATLRKTLRDTDGLHSLDLSFGSHPDKNAILFSAYPDGAYRTHTDDLINWSAEDDYGSGGVGGTGPTEHLLYNLNADSIPAGATAEPWGEFSGSTVDLASPSNKSPVQPGFGNPAGSIGVWPNDNPTGTGSGGRSTFRITFDEDVYLDSVTFDGYGNQVLAAVNWFILDASDNQLASGLAGVGDLPANMWNAITRTLTPGTAGRKLIFSLQWGFNNGPYTGGIDNIDLSFRRAGNDLILSPPGAWAASASVGEALTSGPVSLGAAASGFYTDDNGVTMDSSVPPAIDPGEALASDIHRPHQVDQAAAVGPTYHGAVVSGERRLKRVNADNSVDDVSPEFGGDPFGPWLSRWQIVSNTADRRYMALAAANYDLSLVGIWWSDTYGSTWNVLVAPAAYATTYHRCAINEQNGIYLFGPALIAYAPNLGAGGILDKRGDLPVNFPLMGEVIGIAGAR